VDAHIDHVVIWVSDPLVSLNFYEQVLGFPGLRAGEFSAGKAPFPSVRVSTETIIDLMPRTSAPGTDKLTHAQDTAGYPVNHVCVAMSQAEYEALIRRLDERGIDTSARMEKTYGARGIAPHAFYFRDPDNNVLEARYYD
jgi:glyoxylase I family protein